MRMDSGLSKSSAMIDSCSSSEKIEIEAADFVFVKKQYSHFKLPFEIC